FIMEWMFNGVVFDGFDSSQCLLKEAKARYDQFFDQFGRPKLWWSEGRNAFFAEAVAQSLAAQPRPPVRLRWHFMEPSSYRFFSGMIHAAFPDVEVVFQP
ncbi:Tox-REase-5 domain-containing protein, partial [Massilia glaciei]